MPNQIQGLKFKKFLSFGHLTFIWHLDFGIWIFFLVLSVGLLFKNWTAWHSLPIGLVSLVLYYVITTNSWGDVVARILPLNRVWSRIFGFLVAFYLSAMAIGIPVVVWKYDRLSVAAAMLVVGLLGLVLSLRAKHPKGYKLRGAKQSYNRDEQDSTVSHLNRDDKIASAFGLAMTWTNWHFILLGLLSALFVFFVAHARTGAYILSPWDTLSSFALMLFFAIAFLVGLLVFSNRSSKLILIVLILFSYLAHLYLPVVYETGFGGDKWRHLGAEQWLQDGNIYTPSVWGEAKRSMVNIGPFPIPEALLAGNKTSYAAQWSTTIMISESLGVDLFWVDLLLVFLLWSFFLPLILFQFGCLIFSPSRPSPQPSPKGEGARLGLLLAFLPALFYTFQSEGAITIPVSFGHLFFFFVLLLWLYYVKTGKRGVLIAGWALSLFFFWAYILNFFVLMGVGVLAMAYRRYINLPLTPSLVKEGAHKRLPRLYSGGGRGVVLFGLLVLVSVLAIPFLEIFQGLSSYLPNSISLTGVIDALADAFGRLLSLVGVIVPPDYIDQGNFLYNQSGQSLSRLPLFSYYLIPFLVSSLVWLVIIWGLYQLRRQRSAKAVIFSAIIFIISLGSYFISWSFTQGVHVLSRRLNETIVFFMILFLGYGLRLFLETRGKISSRKKILVICFILAFSAASTYASGPKLQLVTSDELKAAKIVWSELKDERAPYCVIANTWPLLGLEAASARKITAGGFPLYNEYAQPERVKIFEMLSKKPAMVWFEGAFRITKANTCYYMSEKRWLNDIVFKETVELLGEPIQTGTVFIWRVDNILTRITYSR